MTRNSNYTLNFVVLIGVKIWNTLLTWFVVAFTVSLWFLLLLDKRQQLFLWIPLKIIRGIAKIKYMFDIIFYTSLNKLLIKHRNACFWHYNALTKNTDLGSGGTDICFTYHLFFCFLSTYISLMQITIPQNVNFKSVVQTRGEL